MENHFTLKVSKRSDTTYRATIFTDTATRLYQLTLELNRAGLKTDINYRTPQECPADYPVPGGYFKVNLLHNLTHSDVEFIDQQVTLLNLSIQRKLDKMALQRQRFNELLPLALLSW